MKYLILISLYIVGLLFYSCSCGVKNENNNAEDNSNIISQYGITWTFDKEYDYGQFANGDYWVIGPVTIIDIDPPSTEENNIVYNGSMINPICGEPQGYDSRIIGSYFEGLELTYKASQNVALGVSPKATLVVNIDSSLVSSISYATTNNRPYLKTAAVLTVLSSPPQEGSFRPPFSGTDKTIRYNIRDIDYSILGNYDFPEDAPTFEEVERYFERPWLDHAASGYMAQYMHPKENLRNYGRDIAEEVEIGALMLQLDYTDEQKINLLVKLLQVGIDLFAISQNGEGATRWRGGGGHNSGRKLPILMAGAILNDDRMLNLAGIDFQEDNQTYYGTGWTGATALWGSRHSWYPSYDFEHKHPSVWTVDNGGEPGDPASNSDFTGEAYRQCCGAITWVGQALAARMMGLKNIWNHPSFFDYVNRWMTEDFTDHIVTINTECERAGETITNYQGNASNSFVNEMWERYNAQVD